MDSEQSRKMITNLIIVLNGSSALLVMGSLFLIQIFSVLYGVSNGIALQSNYSRVAPPTALQSLVSQNAYLHTDILESYVLAVVAVMLLETAFMLILRRNERTTSGLRKYIMMHTGFAFIYALIFYTIYINSAAYLNEMWMFAVFAGIAISLLAGVTLNVIMRLPIEHASSIKRNVKIDPDTPFSNIMELQEKIFNNLNGHLRIIDKHFNSAALGNFHRLVVDNIKHFNRISVVTSSEMMDSSFTKNVSDFKKELETNNVSFEVRFMDDVDKVNQHERIMLDNKVAYKIPPFNIINKRSEHVILIGHNEAEKRFNVLYGRATSFDNFMVRQSRPQNNPDPQEPTTQK